MSHPSEFDWIFHRSSRVDDAGRSALRPDVDSIVLGVAVSLLVILLSGALWVVGVASADDGEPAGSRGAATVVTVR